MGYSDELLAQLSPARRSTLLAGFVLIDDVQFLAGKESTQASSSTR